ATNGTLAEFINDGTFRQLNSTGTTTFSTPFYNAGRVDVQTGTLVLATGSESLSTARYQVDALPGTPSANLTFSGGTHIILGDVSGSGNVVFAGGSIEVAGTYDVSGSTTVTGAAGSGVKVAFLE